MSVLVPWGVFTPPFFNAFRLMRSASVERTRFILNNFSGIGLGMPGMPGLPLGYAHAPSNVCRVHSAVVIKHLLQLAVGRLLPTCLNAV